MFLSLLNFVFIILVGIITWFAPSVATIIITPADTTEVILIYIKKRLENVDLMYIFFKVMAMDVELLATHHHSIK